MSILGSFFALFAGGVGLAVMRFWVLFRWPKMWGFGLRFWRLPWWISLLLLAAMCDVSRWLVVDGKKKERR